MKKAYRPGEDCQIVSVGKRRDGGTRYWCLRHRANATAKYGKRKSECIRAHIPEPKTDEKTTIDIAKFPGGLALWGAVPPVYDTTTKAMDRGIHVHARKTTNGQKDIDASFRQVDIVYEGNTFPIGELDAIYFMVSTVFGFPMKSLLCDKCGYSHLDKDWFAVHPHKVHLCAGCGRNFRDSERGVGNPIAVIREVTGLVPPRSKSANREIEIEQRQYAGGIQIWASNPAILWSSEKLPESGIHIHAFESKIDQLPVIDDTFSKVVVDGCELNENHIRTFMAQKAMPHLNQRIKHLKCTCGHDVFCEGEEAFTPIIDRRCDQCGEVVRPSSRMRKVIANPLLQVLNDLSHLAVRPNRKHDMQLLPEAP